MVSLKERLQAAADGDFSHFEGESRPGFLPSITRR
jgi:hypothetical protein